MNNEGRNIHTGSPFFFILLTALILAGAGVAFGQATVTTDKSDYAPGSTAYITGSGFQASEQVQLQVLRTDTNENSGPEHQPWTVTADTNGNFATTWYVTPDETGATLQLTATGLTSGRVAQETFTDSSKVISVGVGTQSPATSKPGQSASYTVTVGFNNFSGSDDATLSITGWSPSTPAGITTNFSPNPAADNSTLSTNSTLTFTTTGSTLPGTYTFTVQATDPNNTVTGTGTLQIQGPATKLVYTTVPSTGTVGVAFSVTVQSQDANGLPASPTNATTITLSKATGAGTLTGTLTGTIPTNGNSVTISTPVYSKADTMTLTATATAGETSLTAVTSGNIVFSDPTPSFSGLTASQSVTYGTTNLTLAGQLSATGPVAGPVYPTNGETVTVTINGNAQTTTVNDATGDFSINYNPSTIPFSASAYTITYSYAGDTNLTAATDTSTTLTVNKKTLTPTVTLNDKVYNGTTSATTIATRSLSGIVTNDNVSLGTSGTVAAFSSKNVGSYTPNVTGLGLSGTAAGNYVLSTTSVSSAANITARPLTVTAAANTRNYDGTTSAAATPTVTSGTVQTGDTANFTETYDTKNKGTGKTMTPAGTVTDGNSGTNYTYTFTTSANGTINGAPLTITASNQSKSYGTALSLGTTAFSAGSGLASGEAVTAVALTANGGTNATDAAGTYTITPSAATGTGGFLASNYTITYSTGTLTVNPLAVNLSGTRVYDGTTEAASGSLTIVNNLDGANLTLTGSATLASKDVGSPTLSVRTVTKVNTAAGAVGATAANSFNVTVTAPTSGNTLIAVISTRSATTNAVSSISQTGATWSRVTSTSGTAGTTTEIWYAPNVSGAGTTVTVNLGSSLFAAAVVAEYSGVLSASQVDVTATASGNSTAAVTGTTATTAQTNELWIGGVGLVSSSFTIGTPANSFTSVSNAASASGTSGNNSKVYALEKIVTTTGTASSGGTVSSSSQWSGAMAAFKTTPLALAGSAAGNYTLTGLSGSVTVTAKPLTVTGLSVPVSKVYDGTTTATVSGSPGSLAATEAAGAGTTSDGKPYSVDSASLTGTATGTYNSKNAGIATTVTFGGISLTGTGSGNYSITPPTQAASITARPLTVTAAANTKNYDGTTSAAATPTVTSGTVQTGDTANFSETYDTKNKGTGKTMTPAGSVTDGNSGTNYTYTFTTTTNGIINGAPLTITASNQSKTYGTALSLGTTAFSVGSGLASGEAVTAVALTANGGTNATDAAGTYTITPSAATGTGGFLASNYAITYSTGTLTVNKAATAVAVASSANPAHTGTSVHFTATLPAGSSGNVVFKTNTVALGTNALSSGVATSASTTLLSRGTNTITAEFAGDGNYFGSTNILAGGQIMTNDPPAAFNATNTRTAGTSLKIGIPTLIATSTTNTSGDTLKLSAVGASGQGATITTNSSFIFYLPSTGASSNNNDTFSYSVSDGYGGSATATIQIIVLKAAGSAQGMTISGNTATVNFAGIPGRAYAVQRSTNLTSWVTLETTNAPSLGLFSFTDTFSDLGGVAPASAYYRTAQP